jgi:dUTP pyrophosphatase
MVQKGVICMNREFMNIVEDFFFASQNALNKVDVNLVYLEGYNGGEGDADLCYEKDGDSGFYLRAATNEQGGYQVAPQSVIVIPTGIKVAVPRGTELQVRTRSGSPLKKGFNVANSPGTVDSGYRGEVGVLVHNLSNEVIDIPCGERIAQGVLCPVYQAAFNVVAELDETERGEGAYNSTGVK